MQAVLLGGVFDADWYKRGVPRRSVTDQWIVDAALKSASSTSSGPIGSVASDGRFLYLHGSFGLLKIGSGYGTTVKVRSA